MYDGTPSEATLQFVPTKIRQLLDILPEKGLYRLNRYTSHHTLSEPDAQLLPEHKCGLQLIILCGNRTPKAFGIHRISPAVCATFR
jgi:hypothetical protein